jgi:hypothetical protein
MLIGVEKNYNTGKIQLKMDTKQYINEVWSSMERKEQQKREQQKVVVKNHNKLDHYSSAQEQDSFYKNLLREIDNINIDMI